jgi:hypothetical protein
MPSQEEEDARAELISKARLLGYSVAMMPVNKGEADDWGISGMWFVTAPVGYMFTATSMPMILIAIDDWLKALSDFNKGIEPIKGEWLDDIVGRRQ